MILGYMTAKQAKAHGFTHHGRYYGIPLWIAPDQDFMVATKWSPLEWIMTLVHIMEGLFYAFFRPNEEPSFQFQLGAEIDA